MRKDSVEWKTVCKSVISARQSGVWTVAPLQEMFVNYTPLLALTEGSYGKAGQEGSA